MGRSLLIELEGFVAEGTTVEIAEQLGREAEGAVMAAIPESRVVLWSPRSLPGRSGL
jgi:hypothetical protein